MEKIVDYTNNFDKNNMNGRKKIIINCSLEDFEKSPFETFKKYIMQINNCRNFNKQGIQYLKQFKQGANSILDKIRKDKSNINNISINNFAHQIVEFKKGFTVGKPIRYINSTDETNKNMSFFLKYLKKVNKKSKDINKYENLYTYGIAHTFTSFNRKKEIDTSYDSPFTYDLLDSTKTCCVYSTDIGNPKLFSMVESQIESRDENNNNTSNYTLYTLYYNYKSIIIKYSSDESYSIYREETLEPIKDPITEYELNQDRMGIFEPVLNSLKTLNIIRSNQLDDIEQFINAYIVFINQNSKYILENIEKMRKKRVLSINTNNEKAPADIKMLQASLNHSDINDMFNDQVQNIFNQVGVPMATSNTGQGVSGEAQTYGGGWENAQAFANIETTYISQFEREDLEKFIEISKEIENSKTTNLYDVDIDIKYTINKSNNILVKMQAFKYWIDMGGTWERGLEITDLCDDSHVVGVECEENIDKLKQKEIDLEIEKEKKINDLKNQNNNDDNNFDK